jgi:hypothetical protein
VKRALVILVAFLAALGTASTAAAADECRGLDVCVSVPGPWVAISAAAGRAPVHYQLTCPRGYVAAGVDTRLGERSIDIAFFGRVGSPVAGGITTGREVVFVGTYTGASPRSTSFRPFLGCVPLRGGGGRSTTGRAAPAQGAPPRPSTKRRVRDFRVRGGRPVTLRHGCARNERLVSASHAVAFWTETPPPQDVLDSVRTVQSVRAARVEVHATARRLPSNVRTEVQVHAVCAPVAQR